MKLDLIKLPNKQSVRKAVELINSCPFDSIAQLLLTCALDYKYFENYLKQFDNKFLQFITTFLQNGPTKKAMEARAKLLRSVYPSATTLHISNIPTMVKVNAWDSIVGAWLKLMASAPCISRTEGCSGPCGCSKSTDLFSVSPNWNIINNKGFNALQTAVVNNLGIRNVPCPSAECKGRRTIGQSLNRHVFFELDVRKTSQPDISQTCMLKDFPISMQLGVMHYRYKSYY